MGGKSELGREKLLFSRKTVYWTVANKVKGSTEANKVKGSTVGKW